MAMQQEVIKAFIISDDNTNITTGGTYTITKGFSGIITINTTDAVTIDGTDAGDLKNVRIVTSSETADLKIKNLNITNGFGSAEETGSAITFGSGADNKLTLEGKNDLKTSYSSAGIVEIGGGLTINGTGSLNAESYTVAIGVESYRRGSNLTINSGTINAYGNVAIGSANYSSMGNITINGGTISATAVQGAGIGSGIEGSVGNISINGGIVTAKSSNSGAGIGSGDKGSAGNIRIKGNTVTASSSCGAGIGSGRGGSVGDIKINGGTVTATSTEYGAGIGSGWDGSSGDIRINGGTVTTISDYGAGLGLGLGDSTAGKINISGKSSVLINQINRTSEIVINGETYKNQQLFFEDGVKKTLTKRIRIIVEEIVKNGTDEAEYIGVDNNNWYKAYTINAGAGNDTISASGANISVYAGKGNDSVFSVGIGLSDPVAGYLTIDGGAGDDTIFIGANMGGVDDYYSSISGGSGNDSIQVNGNYVTISGGKGNDTIEASGENSIVYGGAGDDTLLIGDALIKAYYFSINGGSGNDYIRVKGNYATYQYTAGDGNDTIEGYMSENKLQIFGAYYTRSTVGADVIIKVDKGSITLKDAKYETINIDCVEKLFWKLNGTTATYGTELENLITVSGVKSLDGISLKGKVVTVSVKSLNKKNVTISDGYTLKLGNDVIKSKNSVATLINGKYTTAGVSQTGYNLKNNSISYVKKDTKIFKFSGLTSTALAKNIKVDADAQTVQIDSSIVKKSGSITMTSAPTGYSLSRTATEKAPATSTKTTFKNGKYTLANVTSAGYNLDGKKISYVASKSKTELELTGVASKLSAPKNGTVTLKPANFDENISVSSNAGKYKFSIAKGTYTRKNFTGSSKADTITNAGSELTINTGKGNDSIISSGVKVTVNGGDDNDYIKSTGKNSSILGGAGNDSLWGSKGSDTLIGGKGNDSLWGDEGKDTFLYSNGDGKDVIFGFENDDLLQITGTFSASYNKSTEEVSFKVGSTSNAITLKDFTATSFNINGNSYKISGTKLK